MTKINNIARLVVAICTFLAFLSILAAFIYYLSDFKYHNMLDLNLDDYTVSFMIVAMVFFLALSYLYFRSFLRNRKNAKTA